MGRPRFDFEGDVALVTGAASGIGLAVALALAEAGARVHAFDRGEAPELAQLPERARPVFHRVDLTRAEDVGAAVESLLVREGRVDLLVNNAGITRDRALWNLEEQDWQAVLDLNLTAAWRVLKLLAPSMRERKRGRVLQIASINGLRGRFGQSNYSASKAGLIALTRTAARELGPSGITVNAIAPGMIETAMSASLPADVRERARQETALGRLGRAEDIAQAALFLLSEGARHVTGSVLVVDGGQTC